MNERFGRLVLILILLLFEALAIDMVIRPRRHMNARERSGGEMLRAWNELQVQSLGLLFACGAGWMLYRTVPEVWLRWFG